MNQGVLALYLATAGFSLFVLIAVGGQERVPDLSIALAVTMTVLSLALFVRFLHHMVRSLNASAVIRRIAAEGHRAIDEPYPRRTGKSPRDVRAAERRAAWIADRFPATAVTAPRAGYIASVKASDLLRAAERCAGMVEQSRAIGDFVVSGGVLAKVHCPGDKLEHLVRKVGGAFVLNEERIVDDDVAFPIRQLTDIALKGLSPSINDPTTAENAMDSVADSLVRLSRQDAGQLLRTDDAGEPRFRARAPSFDDLVRLGFDQVRRDAARRPSFAVRLIELLAEIRDVGGEPVRRSEEIPRQAALIFEHASSLADLTADGLMVRDAYERFMRQPAGGDSPEPPSRTPAHPAS